MKQQNILIIDASTPPIYVRKGDSYLSSKLKQASSYLNNGDIEECVNILERLYEDGYLMAGNILAVGHCNGSFKSHNYPKAMQILHSLVDKGFPTAMYNLAKMYNFGLCVEKDIKQALYLYKLALSKGYTKSNSAIAHIYIEDETNRDLEEGWKYLEIAVSNKDGNAYNLMGKCYEYGLYVETDLYEAFACYRLALENGAGTKCIYNIARCLKYGYGCLQDEYMATKLANIAKTESNDYILNTLLQYESTRYNLMRFNPNSNDAFSPQTMERYVRSNIEFRLSYNVWKCINDSFTEYWDNLYYNGDIINIDKLYCHISNSLIKEGLELSRNQLGIIIDTMFKWIEQIPNAIMNDDEFDTNDDEFDTNDDNFPIADNIPF